MSTFNMNKPLFARLGFTIFVLLSSAHALAGGVAGGGGTFCQNARVNHGHPILLDLTLSPKPLLDPPVASERISETNMSERFGMDEFPQPLLNKIKKDINARLNLWRQQSPNVVRLIRSALATVQFRITPFWYSKAYRAYVSSSGVCQPSSLEGAAFYHDGEAVVSIPLWNAAGKLSHRGLILHEALRHIQLFNGFPISNAEIQSLTLKIMTTKPRKNESLDDLPFFSMYNKQAADEERSSIASVCNDYSLLNKRRQERQIFNLPKFQATISQICGSANPDFSGLLRPVQKAYSLIENMEPYALEEAKTSQDVILIQKFLNDARASYYGDLVCIMSPNTPYFENAESLAAYFQINIGLDYIRDFLNGNLKLSASASDKMVRYIAMEREKFKSALEGSQKNSMRHF